MRFSEKTLNGIWGITSGLIDGATRASYRIISIAGVIYGTNSLAPSSVTRSTCKRAAIRRPAAKSSASTANQSRTRFNTSTFGFQNMRAGELDQRITLQSLSEQNDSGSLTQTYTD